MLGSGSHLSSNGLCRLESKALLGHKLRLKTAKNLNIRQQLFSKKYSMEHKLLFVDI
jgi:hypothetical protein